MRNARDARIARDARNAYDSHNASNARKARNACDARNARDACDARNARPCDTLAARLRSTLAMRVMLAIRSKSAGAQRGRHFLESIITSPRPFPCHSES
jgi:hypothetical protein